MKILVTGLCTLHWGRLQYGNIGNYYIIEPLFRELHRVFKTAEISTTFQMTEEFAQKENIKILPMEMYYCWEVNELQKAKKEYELAQNINQVSNLEYTMYIKEVLETQLVINVSGDMWGDNAEHVGKDRFAVDLLKMRTAQLLGAKTVLFAGTPGPFTDKRTLNFAKEVYYNFDLIANREPTSTKNMIKWGFISQNVKDYACPAFLYTPSLSNEENAALECITNSFKSEKKIIGFTLGGFNMPVGPYDMWPREEWQYNVFVEVIEYIINELDARVILISHTNGFDLPPHFKLINGRDFPILNQLKNIVLSRKKIKNTADIMLLKGPYLPNMTKSIIKNFDMMVTGRVHASVAAISQYIPTVFLNYEKNFIPSTKMYGFANLAGVGELVCEPQNKDKILEAINYCFKNLDKIRRRLKTNIPIIKETAHKAFDDMEQLINKEQICD